MMIETLREMLGPKSAQQDQMRSQKKVVSEESSCQNCQVNPILGTIHIIPQELVREKGIKSRHVLCQECYDDDSVYETHIYPYYSLKSIPAYKVYNEMRDPPIEVEILGDNE